LCADQLSSGHVNNDGDTADGDFGPSPNNDSANIAADDGVSAHDPWLHFDKLQPHSLHLQDGDDGSTEVQQ